METTRNHCARHDFELDPPAAGRLAEMRAWLRRIVVGATPMLLADLELVCTELVSNALEHATGSRRLRLWRDKDRVRVEVEDSSPDLLPTTGTSRLSRQRGRGLMLVDALASWGVRRDRHSKTLWAELSTASTKG